MTVTTRQFEELQGILCAIREDISNLQTQLNNVKDKPLTEKEVLELLGISSKTLRNYRNEGIIGYSQIGKKYFYRMSDIQRMLQSTYVEPYDLDCYEVN